MIAMNRMRHLTPILLLVGLVPSLPAAEPFRSVSDAVNQKMVKLFGAGGFRSITNYGTGILVSPDGHILTTASNMLDTSELIVHLADGRRMRATVLVVEPELDIALHGEMRKQGVVL
ncbi:MAG: serine protease, partial [Bacteroidales bacterium]|nr:serine protease [Bacteroidales bacterium]